MAAKTNNADRLKKAADQFLIETEVIPIIADENNSIFYIPTTIISSGIQINRAIQSNSLSRAPIPSDSAVAVVEFSFKGKNYSLNYSPNVRTIKDTTQVLIKFSTYFLFFAILLSILIAYFFQNR
ncbi:hypothetical protein [Enterococcus sp. DIV0086]|uniref:hypothetical protein n=1 Tax=Enterococcus sp. DIV0086 TaxID=2774655 RepID=UPI003D2AB2AA